MTQRRARGAASPTTRTSSGCGARSTRTSPRACSDLGIKGIHEVREYKRKYPEGEAAAHVVGFTNVEERGQEGIELAFQKELAGRDGTRRVIKDRLGRVVEDVGDSVAAGRRPGHRPDDRLEGAVLRLPADPRRGRRQQGEGGQRRRPRRADRRSAGARQFPELLARPTARNLTGAQLRNRALTDTFEPGSTMKPFIVALGARDRPRHAADRSIQTAPGKMTMAGFTDQRLAPARQPDRERGDPEVEQRRRGAHRADVHAARDVGALQRRSASARSRRSAFPASSPGACGRTRAGGRSSRRR